MAITLPEQLQKEAEALAQREGIELETFVTRAVERFLHEHQYPTPRAAEAHRRLLEYDKYKKEPVDDLIADVISVYTPEELSSRVTETAEDDQGK